MGKKIPEEQLAAIASKYTVLKEFADNEPNAYRRIRERGLFDKLCGHMKRAYRKPLSEEDL